MVDASTLDALAKLGIGVVAILVLGLVLLRLIGLFRDFMDGQATIQKGLTEALNRISANGELRDRQIGMLADSFANQNRTGSSMVEQLAGIRNESGKTADRAQMMVEHIQSQTRDLSDALNANTVTLAKKIEASEQRVGEKIDKVPPSVIDPLSSQIGAARGDHEHIQEAINAIPNQFREAVLPILEKLEAMAKVIDQQHDERKGQLDELRAQLIEAVKSVSPVTPALLPPVAGAPA